MKRALVAGGAGFLGSHLCDRLLAEGLEVIAVDNLSTGWAPNLNHLAANPRFSVECLNVVTAPLAFQKLDLIFNLASPASPPDYLKMPIETLRVGSIGTERLLDLAASHKAVFVMASTSEVYGDPLVSPQPESYWGHVNPIGPRSVYDEAKRYAEALTMAYHREGLADTRIVRIFNTYGPRMRKNDGRAICNFIPQALKGEPLTLYGSGMQTRSFCYVSDLIDGIWRLSQSDYHEPVNIGNPHEITLLDLASRIIAMMNSKSRFVFQPLPTNDPKRRCPDISVAKSVLGWKPRVSLSDGLKRTIEFFRGIV